MTEFANSIAVNQRFSASICVQKLPWNYIPHNTLLAEESADRGQPLGIGFVIRRSDDTPLGIAGQEFIGRKFIGL